MKNVTISEVLGKGEFVGNLNMATKIFVFFALLVFVAELGYAIGIILKSGIIALIAVFAFNIATTYLPAQLRNADSTAKIMQSVF